MKITGTTIVKEPDEILRTKCEEVKLPLTKKDQKILMDMLKYVRNSHDEEFCEKNGCRASVGIAAPQIGLAKKMLAISIDFDEEEDSQPLEFALVNPKIISNSTRKAYLQGGESCLSVPEDKEGIVVRYYKVQVKAYNMLSDSEEIIKLSGYPAIVMQHEIDHLYGKLYYDHIGANISQQDMEDAYVI